MDPNGVDKGSYCNKQLMWLGSMMIMRMMTGSRAVKMIGVGTFEKN